MRNYLFLKSYVTSEGAVSHDVLYYQQSVFKLVFVMNNYQTCPLPFRCYSLSWWREPEHIKEMVFIPNSFVIVFNGCSLFWFKQSTCCKAQQFCQEWCIAFWFKEESFYKEQISPEAEQSLLRLLFEMSRPNQLFLEPTLPRKRIITWLHPQV